MMAAVCVLWYHVSSEIEAYGWQAENGGASYSGAKEGAAGQVKALA
jgi:hypothetical protein